MVICDLAYWMALLGSVFSKSCGEEVQYYETTSHILCREVYYTVSLFGRVNYQRFFHVMPAVR